MRSLVTFVAGMVVGGVATVATGAWLFRDSLDEVEGMLDTIINRGAMPAAPSDPEEVPTLDIVEEN